MTYVRDTDRMNLIVECDQPTCFWHWRYYPEQAGEALVRLSKHYEKCLVLRPCTTCGAEPGQPCVTRNGKESHRQHNARRHHVHPSERSWT